MQAGKLRHLITLANPADPEAGLDALGQQTAEPEVLAADIWADVQDVNGSEGVQDDQVYGTATHKISLRWLEGVTTKTTITWEGRTLGVVGPPMNPDGRKFEMILMVGRYG